MMNKFLFYTTVLSLTLKTLYGFGAESQSSPYGPPGGTSSFFEGTAPKQPPYQGPPEKLLPPAKKPVIPHMNKPFGMPGVVGLVDGKWEGSDYLGYLTKYIGVDVEVHAPKNTNVPVDEAALKNLVSNIFEKNGLVPYSAVKEGPPLPFLHVLVMVYPVAPQLYTVIAAVRLFEHIQVIRNNFIPTGYWQGITWESQDIVLASSSDLETKIKNLVEKLSKGFANRYIQYNPQQLLPQQPASR